MQPSPQSASAGRGQRRRTAIGRLHRREDLVYQVVTVGAIVTVLVSVWVF